MAQGHKIPQKTHIPVEPPGSEKQHTHRQNQQGKGHGAFSAAVPMEFPVAAFVGVQVKMDAPVVDDFPFQGGLFLFDPQKLVSGDAEDGCQPGQHRDVRAGLVIFPFADGLSGDAQLFRQAVLSQLHFLAVFRDPFA